MKVLFLGDIVGKEGIVAVEKKLSTYKEQLDIDFVIANAENADNGSGLTPKQAQRLFSAGCDVLTNGDHTWRKKEILECFKSDKVLRPVNFPRENATGKGFHTYTVNNEKISVINVMGQVFMSPCDNFIAAVDYAIEQCDDSRMIIVDMHAEATSEKIALARYLDGKVSAVIGTHTHVQTADEQILPNGTAFITDAGMCGSHAGIIGREPDPVITNMKKCTFKRFPMVSGESQLNGVFVEIKQNGMADCIKRVRDYIQ